MLQVQKKSFSILVVDDTEAKRYTITHALKKNGYHVQEAVNGSEALLRIHHDQPDLVVLDVNLPDINGFDICRQIKSNPETSSIMVLMLSASFITSKDRVFGLDEGADAFLTQPIETIELLATVKALLRLYVAEEKSRLGELEFRSIADTIPQLCWMADKDGNVFWRNLRWYEFLGVDKPEQVNAVEFLHPDHYSSVFDKFNATLKSGESWEDTFPMRSKNGEYRWFLSRAFPVHDKRGNIMRWVGTNTDITEQQQVEQKLREAKNKADSANVAKSEFLANMSHEIRTPMNAVIGLANILSVSQPLTDKQKDFIDTLQTSAQSLLSLINDLLDIAKIESQGIELEIIPFELKSFLEKVISIISIKAAEKDIGLILDVSADTPGELVGDPSRLQQILLNLLSNAVKSTEHGQVRLRVSGNQSAGENFIVFDVEDSGIGISPSQLNIIFNKFSQADTSVSRKYGGTGLGLAITKSLAEMMGGSIGVKSTEGKGSIFTLSIPVHSVAVRQKTETKIEAEEKPKGAVKDNAPLVLLVEDYKPNVMVAGHMLEQFGYRYQVAVNGAEALASLEAAKFDIVLMDVQMPVMDGLTATRLLRKRENENQLPRIPVIGITAFALNGDKEKCLASGMDDYLSKPFNPAELKEKIALFLKQSA